MFSVVSALVVLLISSLMMFGFLVLALSIIIGVEHLPFITGALSVIFILYLMVSDYILLYIFKVKRVKGNKKIEQIFNSFKFKNKKTNLVLFFSQYTPVIFKVGTLNRKYLVLNEELLKRFSDEEIKAYLDCELLYTNTAGSVVESLAHRVYIITIHQLDRVLSKILNESMAMFFVSLPKEIYRYIIRNCRKSFRYDGKFVSTLPQAIFKVKILDGSHGKVKVFNYSERCLDLMLDKSQDFAEKRFELEEIV